MTLLVLVSFVGLGFIWVGYPLMMAILAALWPAKPGRRDEGDRSVSVIVATRDDAEAIRARVANLLDCSFPADRLEIVIALDDARARATSEELADLDSRARTCHGDSPGGKAATLNAGVRAAKNDILVFADTAQRFDRDAIAQLVEELRDPTIGAISGSLQLPTRDGATLADRYWRYERWLRKTETRFHSAVGVTGAIYAIRRSEWSPLPAGLILDDVYVPMRLALAGLRVGITERATATDARRFTANQERQRKIRTLTGVIQLCAWLPQVLNPFRNPLWIQFVCHKLLRLLTPYIAVLGAIGVIGRSVEFIVARGASSTEIVSVLVVIGAALAIRRIRETVKAQLAWGFALQSSVVIATINGVRGRWDVWQSQ